MSYLEEKLLEDVKLYAVYSRIKEKAAIIWEIPILMDFTDHGIGHSERIVGILNRLISLWDNPDVNPVEAFVLLSSAYLHDIGMQAMIKAEGKADMLREMHAQYSCGIILYDGINNNPLTLRRLECGFREPNGNILSYDLQVCTALVCKGHSGKYFQEVFDLFTTHPRTVLNQRVDGAFLTALLMVADELDLANRDNATPNEYYTPISRLHQKKHQRIKDLKLDFNPDEHEIVASIQFEFRDEEPPELRRNLKIWVFDKLKNQFILTRRIFRRRMHISISPKVIDIGDIPTPSEAPFPAKFDEEEISILDRETAEMDIYDREIEKGQLSSILKPGGPAGVFFYYNVDPCDMRLLFGWFLKAGRANPEVSFHLASFGKESAITADLKSAVWTTTGALFAETETFTAASKPPDDSLLEELMALALGRSGFPGKPVLLIEDVSYFQPELQADFINMLSRAHARINSNAAVVILSSSPKLEPRNLHNSVNITKMESFSRELIGDILRKKNVSPGIDMDDFALKLYNNTSGAPERVRELVEALRQ